MEEVLHGRTRIRNRRRDSGACVIQLPDLRRNHRRPGPGNDEEDSSDQGHGPSEFQLPDEMGERHRFAGQVHGDKDSGRIAGSAGDDDSRYAGQEIRRTGQGRKISAGFRSPGNRLQDHAATAARATSTAKRKTKTAGYGARQGTATHN